MISPIAVRADVPHDKTTLPYAKHSAQALAQRINTAVHLHYAGTTYLIQPQETCRDDCEYCQPTPREPHWEAA
mgnify:CR=1 FL=1